MVGSKKNRWGLEHGNLWFNGFFLSEDVGDMVRLLRSYDLNNDNNYGGCDGFKLQSSKTQWLALADNTFFSETLTTFFMNPTQGPSICSLLSVLLVLGYTNAKSWWIWNQLLILLFLGEVLNPNLWDLSWRTQELDNLLWSKIKVLQVILTLPITMTAFNASWF